MEVGVNPVCIRRERNVHAQSEYVGGEKGDPKPETEVGSQTGGEDEEAEGRIPKSGSRSSASLRGDLSYLDLASTSKVSASRSLRSSASRLKGLGRRMASESGN